MSEVTGNPETEITSSVDTVDHPSTAPDEPAPVAPGATPHSEPGPPGDGGPTVPPNAPPGWPTGGWWSPAPPSRVTGVGRSAVVAWLIAAVLAMTVVGLAVALGLSGGSTTNPVVPPVPVPRTVPFTPGGVPVPSPVPGRIAAIGTVASVGLNQFTVTSLSGGTVDVNEQSSTTYSRGGAQATSSSVTTGERVVVEGVRNGNAVSATHVIILGAGSPGGGAVPGGL
jgi:hypothetical protein